MRWRFGVRFSISSRAFFLTQSPSPSSGWTHRDPASFTFNLNLGESEGNVSDSVLTSCLYAGGAGDRHPETHRTSARPEAARRL